MACVDIISQIDTVTDDPFDHWFKFEDDNDVDPFDQFINLNTDNNTSHSNDEKNVDSLDIFKFLEENDENKYEEKKEHIEDINLLDFTKTPDLSSLFGAKKKSNDILSKYKVSSSSSSSSSSNITLNIIGLNNRFSMKPKKKDINGKFEYDEIITNLTINNTVYELKKFIKKKYKINDWNEIIIIYSHCILLFDQNKLKWYGIKNNSSIFIAICENKPLLINNDYWQSQMEMSHILSKQLLTFKCIKMSDLDIFTYEITTNCIKMPCGHGIPPKSLYFYAESQYKTNKKIFVQCPHFHVNDDKKQCNQIWYFPLIRKILIESNEFTLNDIIKLQYLSSYNTFKKYFNISNCPKCKNYLYRYQNVKNNKNDRLSKCPYCRNSKFCWKCGEIWKNNLSVYYCGNQNCSNFENEHYEILLKCDTKTIGSVQNVPSIRSCPKCTQLINHTSACKHIECKMCKTNFCFVCLKPMIENSWQCGNSSDICPIAPRQINEKCKTNPLQDIILKYKKKSNTELPNVSTWGDWY